MGAIMAEHVFPPRLELEDIIQTPCGDARVLSVLALADDDTTYVVVEDPEGGAERTILLDSDDTVRRA